MSVTDEAEEEVVAFDECVAIHGGCLNGGRCRLGGRCQCQGGFHGDRCQFSNIGGEDDGDRGENETTYAILVWRNEVMREEENECSYSLANNSYLA